MKLLRISFLLLLVLLSFNVASAEQSQQKEQVEYSFIKNAPSAPTERAADTTRIMP